MEQLQYLALMIGCVLITLPLEFVFHARVYRRPRRLLGALLPVVVVFGLWDALAIARGHWDFATRYVTGITIPGSIPIEEIAFFLAIPLCAILTFEASRRTLGR
jgi:lycopene cyclase domain-containing protein